MSPLYVHLFVCIYTVFMYFCVHACMCLCPCVWVCVLMYINVYVCVCMCTYVLVCMWRVCGTVEIGLGELPAVRPESGQGQETARSCSPVKEVGLGLPSSIGKLLKVLSRS